MHCAGASLAKRLFRRRAAGTGVFAAYWETEGGKGARAEESEAAEEDASGCTTCKGQTLQQIESSQSRTSACCQSLAGTSWFAAARHSIMPSSRLRAARSDSVQADLSSQKDEVSTINSICMVFSTGLLYSVHEEQMSAGQSVVSKFTATAESPPDQEQPWS